VTAGEQARAVELTGLTDESFRRQILGTRTPLYERATNNPPGAWDPTVVNSPAWRAAEIPAVNGHGTAHAVCGLFAALLDSTLLSRSLQDEMATPHCSEVDAVMGAETAWGLGVAVEADGFGMGGAGGTPGGAGPGAAWGGGAERVVMRTASSPARSAPTTGPTSWRTPFAHASGSRPSSDQRPTTQRHPQRRTRGSTRSRSSTWTSFGLYLLRPDEYSRDPTSLVDVGCKAVGEWDHVSHLLHRLVCDLIPLLVWIMLRMIFEGRPVLVGLVEIHHAGFPLGLPHVESP